MMTTATLKTKTVDLANRKVELERDLARAIADEQLARRQQIAEELGGLSLPDAREEQRAMAQKCLDLEKQLDAARLAVRRFDGGRMYLAAANQERRQVLVAELVKSANPKIAAAIATLDAFVKRNALRSGHGVECARAQEAVLALDALKIEALADGEVEKRIAKIMRPIKID